MRCTGWRVEHLPVDLRNLCTYVRLGSNENLPASVAMLLEAAQGQGLMRLVDNCHSNSKLDRAALTQLDNNNTGAEAVLDAGRAIASVLPGAALIAACMHVYTS